MRIELWDLDLIKNDYLATGFTNTDGTFELEYEKGDAGWLDKPDLVLRLLDKEYSYDSDNNPVFEWKVVANFKGEEDVVAETYDFGILSAAFWEYENKEDESKIAFTPRVAVIDGEVPQSQRTGRQIEQAGVALRNSPTFIRHQLINKFNPEKPTIQDIENSYPENLTRKMGENSDSDEYLCDLVLNGFNPCMLEKENDNYHVNFKWNGLTQDGRHFAPNTRATFQLNDGNLVLKSISVQKRVGGSPDAHARYREARVYTPESSVWNRVKRLFRVNYFLFGEVVTHLAETHLNVEQYVVPMRRNLHLNPIARLIFPHFYGTVAVNLGANSLLIDDDGLIGLGSALTPNSVAQLVSDSFGGFNWYDWSPRPPVCESHRFAKISNLFWRTLCEYVDSFVDQNLTEIKKHWIEIYRMSEELTRNSLPYFYQRDIAWYDNGEINTSDNPLPVIDGQKVAISQVTKSEIPSDGDIENLKQLCRYILYFATFKHSWVNDTQYDIGGDVMFASLGVTDDLTNSEINEETVVPSKEALQQPFITYLLTFTEYGYLMRNEDNDVNPEFRRTLHKYRSEFNSLGYDIRKIRSSINT